MFAYLEMAEQRLKPYAEKARLALLTAWGGTMLITIVMWLINIAGLEGANFLFVIISVPLMAFTLLSPKIILTTLGLSALPGAAAKQFLRAALIILYSFGFLATVLATWSFKEAPGAFWALFAVVQMLLLWQLIYSGDTGFSKLLQLGYLVGCAGLILWHTLGGYYNGERFDPNTGAPKYMVDSVSGEVDPLKRSPSDCQDGCFNPATGNPLRQMTRTEAASSNPLSWLGATADCSDEPLLVSKGTRFTINVKCPFYVDQRRMTETGVDLVLVDPCLREVVKDREMINLTQQRGSDILLFTPNEKSFSRHGIKTIELEVYPRGTGDEAVIDKHGVCDATAAMKR